MRPERGELAFEPLRTLFTFGGIKRFFSFKRSSGSAGFTLIELLTVLSIIAILTTIISVNLTSARKQARDVRRKTDVQAIQSAIELYANANGGKVPVSITASSSSSGTNWITDVGLLLYLSTIPVDPINTSPYYYTYQTGNTATTKYSYVIDAVLEVESSSNVNLKNVSMDPSSGSYFVTGTYVSPGDGLVHYRVSSGAN